MKNIITAFILGLSLDRMLICPFFAFSLGLSDRKAGARFLIGRIIGLLVLALVITLFGAHLHLRQRYLNIAFGVIIAAFGITTFFLKHGQGHGGGQGKIGGRLGFGLGLFRAVLVPGRKMVLLVPLLLGAKPQEGFFIAAAYALSSSVYLALAFFFAEALNKVLAYRRALRITGSVFLILIGIYYILIPCPKNMP
jgi:cytochrome c biogenesis protein CcdA